MNTAYLFCVDSGSIFIQTGFTDFSETQAPGQHWFLYHKVNDFQKRRLLCSTNWRIWSFCRKNNLFWTLIFPVGPWRVWTESDRSIISLTVAPRRSHCWFSWFSLCWKCYIVVFICGGYYQCLSFFFCSWVGAWLNLGYTSTAKNNEECDTLPERAFNFRKTLWQSLCE